MQGKKGKGQTTETAVGLTEAFLASQPAGAGDDGEDDVLWREIAATSVLLADFVGGTHLWEALEVCCLSLGRTASLPDMLAFLEAAFCRTSPYCHAGWERGRSLRWGFLANIFNPHDHLHLFMRNVCVRLLTGGSVVCGCAVLLCRLHSPLCRTQLQVESPPPLPNPTHTNPRDV